MIDISSEVLEALKTIKDVEVFFYYPNSFATLPCVSYYEANNSPDSSADDEEYMAEIAYAVDVWGANSKAVNDIAIEVDSVMKAIGFTREFSHDLNSSESNVRQKTMRFIVKK